MRYACIGNKRVDPIRGMNGAVCECCKQPVKAYCGEINTNHFRHLSKSSCDDWYEPITQWHIDWQDKFRKDQREVPISKNGTIHRADVQNSNGTVIEFQKSFIKPEEIRQRESFYENMIWVFSGEEFRKNFNLRHKWTIDYTTTKKNIKAYNWSYPKKHIFFCRKPVFIDFGTDYLYYINFFSYQKPKFRDSVSFEGDEYYSRDSGDYKTYYETETHYYWHPIKLIPRDIFLLHYNV